MIFVVDALPCLPRVVSSWLLGEILRPSPPDATRANVVRLVACYGQRPCSDFRRSGSSRRTTKRHTGTRTRDCSDGKGKRCFRRTTTGPVRHGFFSFSKRRIVLRSFCLLDLGRILQSSLWDRPIPPRPRPAPLRLIPFTLTEGWLGSLSFVSLERRLPSPANPGGSSCPASLIYWVTVLGDRQKVGYRHG